MKVSDHLAFISLLNDRVDDKEVACYVKCITGPFYGQKLLGKVNKGVISNNPLSVLLVMASIEEEDGLVVSICPIDNDLGKFDLKVVRVTDYNCIRYTVTGDDGNEYRLDHSMIYQYYPSMCVNVFNTLRYAKNFLMYLYINRDDLVSFALQENLKRNNKNYELTIKNA